MSPAVSLQSPSFPWPHWVCTEWAWVPASHRCSLHPHCDNLGAEPCSRVLIVHSRWPVLFQTALPAAHTRVQFQPESSKGKSLDSREQGSERSSSLLGFWSPHPTICGAHAVLVHPVDKVSVASKETRESSHSGLEGGFLFFSHNHAPTKYICV